MGKALNKAIECVYEMGEGSPQVHEYHRRHGTPSLLILTVFNQREAAKLCKSVFYEIYGKTVIEIGAGVGFLALEMAKHAKRVYAIESDPAWSWTFTQHLYREKPQNLTWIFGRAEEVCEWLRGDVAIIVTRSGHLKMGFLGRLMAPKVIDVYLVKP